jgi:hypothetical protein
MLEDEIDTDSWLRLFTAGCSVHPLRQEATVHKSSIIQEVPLIPLTKSSKDVNRQSMRQSEWFMTPYTCETCIITAESTLGSRTCMQHGLHHEVAVAP